MSGAQSRLAAAELLVITLEERRTLDEAMARSEAFDALAGSDRGFARAMASAVLRHLGRIDLALDPFLAKPLNSAAPAVRALLRVGAAQAWLLDTPPHAVVGETVNAAKIWPPAQRAAGFLNAVLHKVVDAKETFADTPALSVWPNWLQTEMSEQLGNAAAHALAVAQTEQPELHLTPKNGNATALAECLGGEVVGEGSVRASAAVVDTLPGYADGDWWVQDTAAALPARLLGAQPGEHILDLCAAPGGKTMQLAASGAQVTAIDRSKPRLKRLRENLKRTGFQTVEVIAEDATNWRPSGPVDRILLDAPCSALGTLRRHPEGAWIKSLDDIMRFPLIQARLLRSAVDMLKPGGTLVYCVCSPLPREGIRIVEAELARGAVDRMAIDAKECPAFAHKVTPEGDLLTVPNLDVDQGFSHDAFYIGRLKKAV
ncbi:MAG: transcription antitermination factor NusB [Henriciella sp.]|nr:transcription antitermination factor NusB [Henriciella sp.]